MSSQIVCFGAAHVDTKAVAKSSVVWGSKNPVSTTTSFGGVARNVAENLSRLEVNVALVSRVGQDQMGALVRAHLKSSSIDDSFVSTSVTCRTASFTALLEPQGEMAVAISDMDIYDEITVSDLQCDAHKEAAMWLVDANLPEATLVILGEQCPRHIPLWALGTSVAKNARFLSISDRIDVAVVNEQEARAFQERKPRCMVVTLGARGAVLHDERGRTHFPCGAGHVTDATGAGDAFVAGLAFGFLREGTIDSAMAYAHACARMTLSSMLSVSEQISQSRLFEIINQSRGL